MLLELKDPVQARTEFAATLKKEPNRFRAVYGAARASSLSGDRVAARRYYDQLLKICERGDKPGRTELADVRQAR
jgi:Tfp pilus assembly protein PilF